MINILIHACPEREWYVNDYLVPRIRELEREKPVNLDVYVDEARLGNQRAFLYSVEKYCTADVSTWHLQDDVWPSDDFIDTMELYENVQGIICGFGTRTACRGKIPGWTTADGMYTSFQCIRIPGNLIFDFRDYVVRRYTANINTDKWDDALFREYLLRKAPFYPVLNLAPSIVEHVDYIIGGSIINKQRKYRPTAIEFDEAATALLVERLKRDNKQ